MKPREELEVLNKRLALVRARLERGIGAVTTWEEDWPSTEALDALKQANKALVGIVCQVDGLRVQERQERR